MLCARMWVVPSVLLLATSIALLGCADVECVGPDCLEDEELCGRVCDNVYDDCFEFDEQLSNEQCLEGCNGYTFTNADMDCMDEVYFGADVDRPLHEDRPAASGQQLYAEPKGSDVIQRPAAPEQEFYAGDDAQGKSPFPWDRPAAPEWEFHHGEDDDAAGLPPDTERRDDDRPPAEFYPRDRDD